MTLVPRSSSPSSGIRPRWPVLVLALPFLASVFGAYAWFNTDIGRAGSRPRIWLESTTNIPGYTFVEEPISDEVKKTLGTTNILNGMFHRIVPSNPVSALPGDRVSVFAAVWTREDRKGLSAVQHTPEICWVANGWKRIALDRPKQVQIIFPLRDSRFQATNLTDVASLDRQTGLRSANGASGSHISLPFECRAFELPHTGTKELGVWFTLVGGKILSEPERSPRDDSTESQSGYISRQERSLAESQFTRIVIDRVPSFGDKQFIRYSMPLLEDWNVTVKHLQTFGSRWLKPKFL